MNQEKLTSQILKWKWEKCTERRLRDVTYYGHELCKCFGSGFKPMPIDNNHPFQFKEGDTIEISIPKEDFYKKFKIVRKDKEWGVIPL